MFVDDVNTPGGSSLTAHLDDLAARHPEIADHLYDLIPKNRKFGSGLREHGKSGDKKYIPKSKQKAEVTFFGVCCLNNKFALFIFYSSRVTSLFMFLSV